MTTIPHPLHREGTIQNERFPLALGNGFVNVDEKTDKDFCLFFYDFSKAVRYYNVSFIKEGNWQIFFQKVADYIHTNEKFTLIDLSNFLYGSPLHTLLFTFLELFKNAQNHLNESSQRHLDFYYEQILQLKTRPETPDSVHLIAELSKNFQATLIPKNTKFKAGKDGLGKDLTYVSNDDILVNRASIAQLKTLLIDKSGKIHAAETANSADGKGKALENTPPSWATFGSTLMPQAEIGFALSSPVFFLKDGIRTITLRFTLNQSTLLSGIAIKNAFKFEITCEKTWLEITNKAVLINGNKLEITLILDEKQEAVKAYNLDIHQRNFATTFPILKASLSQNADYQAFKSISFSTCEVFVNVMNSKDLILQNDFGKLDASKPFMPFGAIPSVGTNFYLGNSYIFNRYLSSFNLFFDWNNLPANFTNYYADYIRPSQPTVVVYGVALASKIFEATLLSNARWGVINNHYSILDTKNLNDDGKTTEIDLSSPNNTIQSNAFEEPITEYNTETKNGFLRLQLLSDFGHEIYPTVLAERAVKQQTPLPNKPYLPVFKEAKLSYNLYTNISQDSENHFYHLQPFGYETLALNNQNSLIPQFFDNGYLFIGLQDTDLPQAMQLLFQFNEGQGNPDFTTAEKLEWKYLDGNQWKTFETKNIFSDSTNHFTRTGIVKFALPKRSEIKQTILDENLFWLMISVANDTTQLIDYQAYDPLIEVRTQAFLAIFLNQDNDPNRLVKPLEANSISKFEEKVDGIKSISQPYSSFGGLIQEALQTNHFYTRVSERLRHKNRAWSMWDYERIVLENFPFVYRAKTISHSDHSSWLAPGHTLVVAVPDLQNVNTQDLLKPRISLGNLKSIETFLKKKISPFVKLTIENPDYEAVTLNFNVKFTINDSYYLEKLNQEIISFLSPWTTGNHTKITFGGHFYKSTLINFIEERDYVDFVTDFKMKKDNGVFVDIIEASQENVVLTSAQNHQITMVENC